MARGLCGKHGQINYYDLVPRGFKRTLPLLQKVPCSPGSLLDTGAKQLL